MTGLPQAYRPSAVGHLPGTVAAPRSAVRTSEPLRQAWLHSARALVAR